MKILMMAVAVALMSSGAWASVNPERKAAPRADAAKGELVAKYKVCRKVGSAYVCN